jgi:hypothetical protein
MFDNSGKGALKAFLYSLSLETLWTNVVYDMLPVKLIFLVANVFLLKMFQSEQIKKQWDVATIPVHHKAQYSSTRDAISIHGYDVTHSDFRYIGWWNGSNLAVPFAGTQGQNEQAETKELQLC